MCDGCLTKPLAKHIELYNSMNNKPVLVVMSRFSGERCASTVAARSGAIDYTSKVTSGYSNIGLLN